MLSLPLHYLHDLFLTIVFSKHILHEEQMLNFNAFRRHFDRHTANETHSAASSRMWRTVETSLSQVNFHVCRFVWSWRQVEKAASTNDESESDRKRVKYFILSVKFREGINCMPCRVEVFDFFLRSILIVHFSTWEIYTRTQQSSATANDLKSTNGFELNCESIDFSLIVVTSTQKRTNCRKWANFFDSFFPLFLFTFSITTSIHLFVIRATCAINHLGKFDELKCAIDDEINWIKSTTIF